MPLHVSSKLDWANHDRLSCSRNARLGTPRSTRAMKVSRDWVIPGDELVRWLRGPKVKAGRPRKIRIGSLDRCGQAVARTRTNELQGAFPNAISGQSQHRRYG